MEAEKVIDLALPLWLSFRDSGFPFCHENCARNYWIVTYDLGVDHETSYKMGLN